jgi:hypothetical protein
MSLEEMKSRLWKCSMLFVLGQMKWGTNDPILSEYNTPIAKAAENLQELALEALLETRTIK